MGKIIFKPCTGKSFTSLWQRSGTWEACLQNPHVMLMRGHAWRHVLSGMVLKFLQAPGRSSFHVLLPCREAFRVERHGAGSKPSAVTNGLPVLSIGSTNLDKLAKRNSLPNLSTNALILSKRCESPELHNSMWLKEIIFRNTSSFTQVGWMQSI